MGSPNLSEQTIRKIVAEVSRSLRRAPSLPLASRSLALLGVHSDVDAAVQAASVAYWELRNAGMAGRSKIIEIIKTLCAKNSETWGQLEFEETCIGRLEHKIFKLRGLKAIPGVEWLRPLGMSGDHGIAMEEGCPWGVLGVVTPVTHSIPTIASNAISMIAAGNTLVINPHPSGAKCAAAAVHAFNEAIRSQLRISHAINVIAEPTIESFEKIGAHPDVRLLCVTGGPGVVQAALAMKKRAVCAGPGNPPVFVDETAELDHAAASVIEGGGFDNNLLCIGEKEVFALHSICDRFMSQLEKRGAVKLTGSEVQRLAGEAFAASAHGEPVLNRELVGKDPAFLARIAGRQVPSNCPLLFGETDANNVFVQEEQMMPFLPVARVSDVSEGITQAKRAESGYRHSSMIHSLNVRHMTEMAQALESVIFVKNGSSLAAFGSGGEGHASYSIATTTGEGITTPMTYTRSRRCVMVDDLRIW